MAMQTVFTGKNGEISLSNGAAGQPERDAAGQVLPAYLGASPVIVGRATGVHVAVTTNLQEFHQIGQRFPVVLHPGNISISGSIAHAYLSGAMITLLLGKGATGKIDATEQFVQPAFDITLDLSDPAVSNEKAEMVLVDVKFHNWAFRIPEDDFVMEDVTFRALSIKITDTGDDGKEIKLFTS
jgi:hypothetical protein